MIIDADRLELLLHPAAADAEQHPALREQIDRRELLGEVQRMALRKYYDTGRELDLAADRGGIGERDQRIGNRDVIATRHLAVLRAGIRHMRLRHDHVFDRPERL